MGSVGCSVGRALAIAEDDSAGTLRGEEVVPDPSDGDDGRKVEEGSVCFGKFFRFFCLSHENRVKDLKLLDH